ncbi:MAG: NAD(P)/FAD-dependent oxidoreductase [Thalassococcus sp.]|uniref:FAD-dependent oxidoreductase n=1 Tax=Thalassococcus sp. TaxID=1928858 RepID=UPI001B1459DB|nr:FAD-dependent oxidoreductase [Thalassococcus sp.]MBO6868112.1 NAD(P)/FAD-dependent oxidoreductase [Thalassococcus sp.]
MQAAENHATYIEPDTAKERIIVVGGGPVGVRTGQLLAKSGHYVTLLSDEAHKPYNRVRLTPLLGGDVQFGEIELDDVSDVDGSLAVLTGMRVMRIDRDKKEVVTGDGSSWPYDKLVLATGSSAFVPGIQGRDLPGVFTFRTADDASALLARSFSARNVVIIGGGLLGLEAARGLQKRQCNVTVIEHEGRLMPRQLDVEAGELLKKRIQKIGVAVKTGVPVSEIEGETRVSAVSLGDGTRIECDTVVICTGVRANVGLAQNSGLAFNRGIRVNDQMQTTDENIYAVGECAQHDGRMYGLVGPGYAQAEVAAKTIDGEAAEFHGHIGATKLKVIGADVFSAGDVEQLETRPNVKSHVWRDGDSYRRIFIERGKLVGAIAIGAWDQVSRIQDAVQSGAVVYPWMNFRFYKEGSFWSALEPEASDLPDSATICNCTGVSCGQIRAAISNGAGSEDEIGVQTGAGTVCGTCRPVLAELIDAGAPPKPVSFSKPLIAISAVAVLMALIPILIGAVPLPASYDADSLRTWLWRDNIVKQWSGFILLGVMLAAMLIGLRKRIRFFDRFGGYDGWRLVHLAIGLLAVAGFFAHTGFRLGSNLNFLLGITFILTLILGAAAGLATGGDHALRAKRIGTARKPARRLPTWGHILAIWPLPVLILLHVLVVYAY